MLLAAFLGSAPTVALAYIDPGNGAYMVQVLFTLVGAALFYVRHPIRSLKLLWRRLTRGSNPDPEAGADPASPAEEPKSPALDALQDAHPPAVRVQSDGGA